ncbi:ulp1 protease family, C-terminal catalytic domain-containing protein, partial [Tanacetum coccineum]
VDKKVFRQTDDFYYSLNATDIIDLLTYKELELGILTLFAMSLYQLKDHSKTNKVGFLNPMMITADACFQLKFATMDYLTQSLTGYDFYLAPFLQGRHYVLLIICPKDGKGFILNLQKDAQTNENCYRLAGLVNSFPWKIRLCALDTKEFDRDLLDLGLQYGDKVKNSKFD